jgi:hypothetical protein
MDDAKVGTTRYREANPDAATRPGEKSQTPPGANPGTSKLSPAVRQSTPQSLEGKNTTQKSGKQLKNAPVAESVATPTAAAKPPAPEQSLKGNQVEAKAYIDAIRKNPEKKAYAQAYLDWVNGGKQGAEPTPPKTLKDAFSKAVRLTVDESLAREPEPTPASPVAKPAQVESAPAKAPKVAVTIRSQAKEFNDLVIANADEHKWASGQTLSDLHTQDPGKSNLGTVGIKGAITRNKAVAAAQRQAAKDLGLDPDQIGGEKYRAQNLDKLKQLIGKKENFKEATKDTGDESGKMPVDAKELSVGEKLIVDGEPVEVAAVNKDHVVLKDGRKFGIQRVSNGETLYVEGYEPKVEEKPALELSKPESVEEQTARMAQEEAARVKKAQVEELAKRANRPLVGSQGDIGQTDMLGGGDLLSGPGSPSIPQGPGARTFQPSAKPESYEATSLKNAVAELERAGLGLPDATPTMRQNMAERWIKAGETLAKDPTAGQRLADDLKWHPERGLTDDESALLLRHKTNLFNALNDAAEKTIVGDAGSRLEAKTQYANLTDEFNTLLDAIKARGSEWGREGRWRQAMAYEDYTMATQERLLKASLGRDLTVGERENLIRQIAEHKRLTEQLQQHLAQRDQKIAEMEVKAALDKVALEAKQQPTYHPSIMAAAEKIVVGFENRAKTAAVRLRGKLAAASALVDPTIVLDVAEIGAGKLARYSLDAAKWSKAMLDEYGPKIEPYLKQGYEDAKKFLETNLSKVKGANAEKIKRAVRGTDFEEKKAVIADNIGKKIASGKRGEITNAVQRLARLFVEQGVKTRDGLIDAVHGFISEIDPTITRRDAMDAISGYGDFKQLTKDEISVQLRDLKGQMQQVAKLEDMQAGKPPVKTGVERRTPSREESKLIQQVNDTKRKFQIPVDDPNTQLRSPLDELKKRMQTRIADLTEKMAAGDYSRKPAHEPIKLDSTAIKLQADKLRVEKTFKHNRMLAEAAQRKWWQKGLDTFVRWERAFKLSSPVVFGKLGAAALTRVGATALEEPLGGVLSKVPGISRVAAHAPREGGLNVRAMAHGITEAFNRGIDDAWQTAKKGGADIDVAYGDKILDKDWANFFGQLHGMMKAPIKRAEFTLSLDKRVQHAIANGIDVTDPMVQTRLATEALSDGYRSIFMQRGFSSDMFNQAVGMMEKSKKYPVAGEVTARLARFLMPVVRVPLNILGETATGIYGTPVASARTMFHAMRGTLDTLDPVVADSIMRQFKKGSIGLGLMAIGYFNPQNVGGYDWRQKRKTGEVKTSGFQIGGVDIPRWVTHAPWFELMQIGSTIRRVSDEHIPHTSDAKGFTIGAKAALLGLVEESPFIGQILRADKVFGTDSEQTQYWGQLAQSTVDPQLLIKAAQLTDLDKDWSMIQRKPKTIGQYIETGIPGLRQNVPEKGGGGSTYYGPTPAK